VFESLYSDQSSPASHEVGLFRTDRVTDRVEQGLPVHGPLAPAAAILIFDLFLHFLTIFDFYDRFSILRDVGWFSIFQVL
jgi:hypothetical protein